jgi:cytochrome c553
MLSHYADTVALRRGIVAGKLAEAQAAAAAVAADGWTPRLRGDYQPHVTAVRESARAAQKAPNLQQAARELGELAKECASCHVKFGGPGSPVAPEQLSAADDATMVAHAVGTDRAWEGLVLPSDYSWASGMQLLLDAPSLNSDVADVAAAARQLRSLAEKGRSADGDQRAEVFANILLTCSGCHERLGVAVRGPSR